MIARRGTYLAFAVSILLLTRYVYVPMYQTAMQRASIIKDEKLKLINDKGTNIEISSDKNKNLDSCQFCRKAKDFENIQKNSVPIKKLLIFTNKRSGSSFIGELFNKNRNVFYLFEPLFPYTRRCDVLKQERIETLRKIMTCKLSDIGTDYEYAFNITKHGKADCLKCGICFYSRHIHIAKSYNFYDTNIYGRIRTLPFHECPFHLNMETVSKMCNAMKMTVNKILRVCQMEALESMFNQMFYEEPNLHDKIAILHLLRDPRAIISSRLKLNLDETRADNYHVIAKELCNKMEENIAYSDSKLSGIGKTSSGNEGIRYFRVRYEDVASFPMDAARAIYRYFGMDLPAEVSYWIKEVTNANAEDTSDNQFSTRRDRHKALNGWRNSLTFEQVLNIQDQCKNVMKLLHYKLIHTEIDLRNSTNILW